MGRVSEVRPNACQEVKAMANTQVVFCFAFLEIPMHLCNFIQLNVMKNDANCDLPPCFENKTRRKMRRDICPVEDPLCTEAGKRGSSRILKENPKEDR